MKELFKDILNIQDVEGIILFSHESKIIYNEFKSLQNLEFDKIDFTIFFKALDNIRESELIFNNKIFYIKKCGVGYLIIVMDKLSQIAMVRLNCDILMPSLDQIQIKKTNWFGKIFKR